MLSGLPSSGSFRPMSTGNLRADVERWCRDNLPLGEAPAARGTTLRLVAGPVASLPAPNHGSFRPDHVWAGILAARTGR